MNPILLAASALALLAGGANAQSSLSVGLQLEPPHLDPTAGAAGAIDDITYSNIFEGLTRFASDGSVMPGLAESWNVSADGTVYTFHLREGVTFHDGSAMDAEDVKFSLDRARAEESTNAQKGLFAGISDVTVIDPATVEVTLSATDGNFPFNLAWGDAAIVAPETAETNETDPVGTGAFTFENWVQGDRIELARYPDYWGEPASLERATFRFIADPTAAFAAMMAEDIDVFSAFPAPENVPQFEADARFQVLVGSTEGETILAMNNRTITDVRVREAIARAIDRSALIDGVQFGYGEPIGTHFAPHNPAYLDLTGMSAHDPERARGLLAEAGAEGLTLSLKLPPPSYARRGGEIIAAQLREVGIETTITNLEWAQWLEEVFTNHDFDLTVISHTEPMDIGIYADPDYYFGYDEPELQALMTELGATTDAAARTQLLQQAQTIIAENFVNAYLFQLPRITIAKAGVQGLWADAPTQAVDLTGVSWAQ